MPKTLLTGTLEEQCAFLYNMAQEKAAVGNYAGASYALKEILAHAPDYPGAAELMTKVKAGKREQNLMLVFVFGFAILAVAIGRIVQVPNDWWFLGLILVGAVTGFLLGNTILYFSHRSGRSNTSDSLQSGVQAKSDRVTEAQDAAIRDFDIGD